jgi:hypothetical protein
VGAVSPSGVDPRGGGVWTVLAAPPFFFRYGGREAATEPPVVANSAGVSKGAASRPSPRALSLVRRGKPAASGSQKARSPIGRQVTRPNPRLDAGKNAGIHAGLDLCSAPSWEWRGFEAGSLTEPEFPGTGRPSCPSKPIPLSAGRTFSRTDPLTPAPFPLSRGVKGLSVAAPPATSSSPGSDKRTEHTVRQEATICLARWCGKGLIDHIEHCRTPKSGNLGFAWP